MADYRDEHAALAARVETLERELEDAKTMLEAKKKTARESERDYDTRTKIAFAITFLTGLTIGFFFVAFLGSRGYFEDRDELAKCRTSLDTCERRH